MIESITLDGFRTTGTLTLGEKTLVVGDNGAGKSAYAAGFEWAHTGSVYGEKAADAYTNCVGRRMMVAAMHDGGKTVARSLTKGSTIKTEISINGGAVKNAGTKYKAEIDEELAKVFGKKPQAVNMPLFWGLSVADQRKVILKTKTSPAKFNELLTAEDEAKKEVNRLTAEEKRVAGTIQQLSKRLVEQDKPAGNLKALERELEELRDAIVEQEKTLASARQNDALRKEVESAKADEEALKKQAAQIEASLAKLADEIKAAEKQQAAREECKPTISEAKTDKPAVVEVLHECAVDLYDKNMGTVAKRLNALILTDEETQEYMDAIMAWLAEVDNGARYIKTRMEFGVRMTENLNGAKSRLQAIATADETLAKIGPGVDPNDEEALVGMQSRKAELNAAIPALQSYATLEKELRVARVDVETLTVELDKAKEAKTKAADAINDTIKACAKYFREKSTDGILPEGHIHIEDDGRTRLQIGWQRDLFVPRQSLSGGEKAIFDAAMASVLVPSAAIWIEAAECDDTTLAATMEKLAPLPQQVVILTCHWVDLDPVVADEWTVVRM